MCTLGWVSFLWLSTLFWCVIDHLDQFDGPQNKGHCKISSQQAKSWKLFDKLV